MQLYYHPSFQESVFELSEEESAHIRVVRLQPGELIHITNGKGTLAEAEIVAANKKTYTVALRQTKELDVAHPTLELAISPLKNNERIEWLLEKATEMGIHSFAPIVCKRSERKTINGERLRKVIVSAGKQSNQAHFPVLKEPVAFNVFVSQPFDGRKWIAFCGEGTLPINELIKTGENVRILIGPEGDFTEEEVKLAFANGYQPISLGNTRLRSETAGLYAVACFKFLNGL